MISLMSLCPAPSLAAVSRIFSQSILTTEASLHSASQTQSHIATDGQSVSKSWCRAPSGAHDQICITFDSYGLVFMGRPL
jgi:hypothetical protein